MAKGPGCYSWVGVGELVDEVAALVPATCRYCHGERVAPAVEDPGVHSSCAGGGVRGQTDQQAPCRSLRGVLSFEDLGGEGLKEGCWPSGESAVIALKAAAMSA